MARIETFRSIYKQAGIDDPAPAIRRTSASMSGYDAGGLGYRGWGWQPSRLGSNTLLLNNLENIRARSRDMVRNNAWGTAAIDRFESNSVGTGIQPHWQHPDPKISAMLQVAWARWQQDADWNGQMDFYGLQGVMAREIFEAGEVFLRFRYRGSKDGLYVPFQIQLLEGEQLPIFLTEMLQNGGAVRCGIEFDSQDRRVAYRFYRHHPGDSMFWPDAYTYISIPADEICHVYKPARAGQLRGHPRMSAVLTALYELDQYTDSALVKKKVSAMMAGFVSVPTPENLTLPTGVRPPQTPQPPPLGPPYAYDDPRILLTELEPGTFQRLLPGETITFSQTPVENDFDAFLTQQLHKFAAGVGMPYHMLTGDLRRINYSSIRAGLLEFRRACEQFQVSILVRQACRPVLERFLLEAVLAGRVQLPNYRTNPWIYRDVNWVSQGWDWVDPKNESDAAMADVRNGFTSREMIVRSRGLDPAQVDAQNAADRQRQEELGLVYDSNPNKVLIGRETQPMQMTPTKSPGPALLEEGETGEETEAALHIPVQPNGRPNGKGPVQ